MKKVTRLVDMAPGDPANDSFIRVTTDQWDSGYGGDKYQWADVYIVASNNYRIAKLDLEAGNEKAKARNLRVLRLLAKHLLEAAAILEKSPVGIIKGAGKKALPPTTVVPKMRKKKKA